MMKKLILIILLLNSYLFLAQEPPKMLKYVAKNAANIFYYDLEEAPKKVKIKKDKTKNATLKALRVYNSKVKDISFLNSFKLNELEILVNSVGKQARTNPEIGQKIRSQIRKTILPIRDTIGKLELNLNNSLKDILSEKQFKKWKRYQEKVKKELLPKQPKRRGTQRTRPTLNQRNRRRF